MGALLFSLSFPSFLNDWGFGFLAFFSLIPVFVVIHRSGWLKALLYGAFYGFFTYRIFNFWMAQFNPLSYVVVPLIYAGFFASFFLLFKWADKRSPRYGWLFQTLFWLCYEVVRTKGFIGYSYGIIGYSQYDFLSLIGIADITGVLGVSALVVLPSAYIAHLINRVKREELLSRPVVLPLVAYILLFGLVNVYGLVSRVDYSRSPTWRTALVQHNVDAWRSGMEEYKKAYESLSSLSEEALSENPDVIIWPETAFVPAIEWHEKYRQEAEKLVLIRKLRAFLREADTPFIIGNNDSRLVEGEKVSRNAVLLFDKGEIVERYFKLHLVPFGEYFAYANLFPRFEAYMRSQGATRYVPGTEWVVFNQDGVKFSGLICYEDAFPYLSRGFVREGADLLVNITNDAWSPAHASCMQHGTMAVFRSVENRRTMVRSTCSGFTAVISPNGEILDYLEPFTYDTLVYDAPIYSDTTTVFTRLGEWFDWTVVLASLLTVILFALKEIKEKRGYK